MMKTRIHHTTLELVQGDITQQDVDAIVNAANESLLGGGGVDGAIHRVAGSQLLEETRLLGGCNTGDAKITKGYRLKARHVIHAVGPVYQKHNAEVPSLLVSAYRRSLEVAVANHLTTLAFPAISTGIYGYPMDEASHIALNTVCQFLTEPRALTLVRFVLFDARAFQSFEQTLSALLEQHHYPLVRE